MKTIIDCNVIISAGITKGKCRKVIYGIIKNHQNYISEEILKEYLDVISRNKFKKYYNVLLELVHLIAEYSEIIIISNEENLEIKKLPDSDDEIYLLVALKCKIDYIITGNLKHFPDRIYKNTVVLNPNNFLDLL